MMGNVIVWKPAETQMYSAQVIMKKYKNITVLIEALKNNDPELFNLRLESSSSSRKISKTSIQNLKLYLLSD